MSRAPAPAPLKGRLQLETPLGGLLTESRVRLLEAIDRVGSLNRAAREVPLSYKAAWDALDTLNAHAPQPLVHRQTGGAGGGGTQLTDEGRRLVALYRAMERSQQDVLDRLPTLPAEEDPAALRTQLRRLTMRSSARNQFEAEVTALHDAGGRVDVRLALCAQGSPAGVEITATITPESAREMGLQAGAPLYALIKAPWVQLSQRQPRAQAQRNRLAGQVQALRLGHTHTGVTLAMSGGLVLQANVPSADAAGLAVGDTAWGLFDTDSVVLVSFA